MNKPLAFPGKPWCKDDILKQKRGRKKNHWPAGWDAPACFAHSLSAISCCCEKGILAPQCDEAYWRFSKTDKNSNLGASHGCEFPRHLMGTCERGAALRFCLCKRLLSARAGMCVGKEGERCKGQIRLRSVYCSTSDVVASGFLLCRLGGKKEGVGGGRKKKERFHWELQLCAVVKEDEPNLRRHQSSVSHEGWRSAGTRATHWSS